MITNTSHPLERSAAGRLGGFFDTLRVDQIARADVFDRRVRSEAVLREANALTAQGFAKPLVLLGIEAVTIQQCVE